MILPRMNPRPMCHRRERPVGSIRSYGPLRTNASESGLSGLRVGEALMSNTIGPARPTAALFLPAITGTT